MECRSTHVPVDIVSDVSLYQDASVEAADASHKEGRGTRASTHRLQGRVLLQLGGSLLFVAALLAEVAESPNANGVVRRRHARSSPPD